MGRGKGTLLPDILKVMFIFLAALAMLAVVLFIMLHFVVGGNKVEVPNVIGKSFKEAFDTLSQQKLRIAIEGHKYNADLPEDYVVEQRPLPNQKTKADRVVKVFLSMGSEEETVPRVIGQTVSESESIFKSVGLEVGSIVKVHSDDFPQEGVIIAQTPPPNIKFQRGGKVNLLVSLGTYDAQLTMPDLGGMKLQSALGLLESTDLKPGKVTRVDSPMVKEPDIVLQQTPQPDNRVEKGATVDLVVSIGEISEETSRVVVLRYTVPARPKGTQISEQDDSNQRHVKIVLEHAGGTRVVVDQTFSPGKFLEYPLRIMGRGVAKIYVDDMEWPLEIMKW